MESEEPNRQSADEEFHEAVRVYLEKSGYGEGLLVDWVLVTAQHTILAEGGSATSLAVHVSREQSVYRTAGLLQYAATKVQQNMVRNG